MMIRIALIGVLLLGCKIKNELSCDDPANEALAHCSNIDAPEACTVAGPCPGGGVCKLPDGVCVGCIENSDCEAATPICSATNQCERCTAHADCDSNVCDVNTGMCIAETDVAYVVDGGTGNTAGGCARAAACDDLTNAIGTTKPFIKFDSVAIVDVGAVQLINRDVTIFAEIGAKLRRTSGGAIIQISAPATVTIFDLEIREGLGGGGHAIEIVADGVELTLERVLLLDNGGRGVDSGQVGTVLNMRRCVISGNLAGGLDVQDLRFDIVNTLFVRNGAAGSTVGGLRIAGQDALSTFRFNTVANNSALEPTSSGVNCDTGFTANHNIVADNGLDTTCVFDRSLFNGVIPLNGTNNLSGMPAFAEIIPTNARANNYYRLTSTSDAIDEGDPAATEAVDIDGQVRPNGAARDMGADEFVP